MKVFIVYAHPEPKSFNGALKDLAVSELTRLGHEVKVSDLYAMRFNPVAGRHDFTAPENPDCLSYMAEQRHAAKTGTFAPDIRAEQEKLLWADFVIFQFPLWWFSLPAILKGWFDRVMASGFAYGRDVGKYETGGLKGRKAMLSVTTGAAEGAYTRHGIDGDIHEQILFSVNHGILFFTGLQPVQPFIAYRVAHDEERRRKYLEEFRNRLHRLDELPLIPYHPSTHYGPDHQLKEEYR